MIDKPKIYSQFSGFEYDLEDSGLFNKIINLKKTNYLMPNPEVLFEISRKPWIKQYFYQY